MTTDFHNHVIPGVDDGARDADEARAAVEAFAAQGFGRVVATPHLDGSLTLQPDALDARLAELDAGFERLRAAVPDELGVRLDRGAEVRLDAPELDLSDPRLRLAGTKAVLVEFAHFTIPPRSGDVLSAIVRSGWQPVLAHPERYRGLGEDLGPVRSWLDAGAYLQVNAGSLLGRYGDRALARAEALLGGGWVHLIASDYHARGEPDSGAARSLLESRGAAEQARTLFDENPTRLLEDRRCMPASPIAPSRSFADRLRRWLRRNS